ncbi:hypothetical protein PINS_up016383 [Pythium insidiosum]|nr:hypothetical protein PINS_up016383 [Pythium insidiosum]
MKAVVQLRRGKTGDVWPTSRFIWICGVNGADVTCRVGAERHGITSREQRLARLKPTFTRDANGKILVATRRFPCKYFWAPAIGCKYW